VQRVVAKTSDFASDDTDEEAGVELGLEAGTEASLLKEELGLWPLSAWPRLIIMVGVACCARIRF